MQDLQRSVQTCGHLMVHLPARVRQLLCHLCIEATVSMHAPSRKPAQCHAPRADALQHAAPSCCGCPVCTNAELARLRSPPSIQSLNSSSGMSFGGGASQIERSQAGQARLQYPLRPEQATLLGDDLTCMYRRAFSAVTAPACAPSASMAGMKHDRWSILCFTTPTLQYLHTIR